MINKHKKNFNISLAADYAVLIIISLLVLIPFYIIFITSLKTNSESLSIPFTWWPKHGFSLEGYKTVLFNDASGAVGGSSVLRGFLNTLIIVIPTCIIGLISSAVSSYAFAKMEFPCKRLLFSLLLFTMMLPGVITLTPSYLIYNLIGWIDTKLPLMIPGMFGSAGVIFFLRQYYMGLPDALIESAKLDGCSTMKVIFMIMIPLSKTALTAQFVLMFIGGYNDYFGPLLYLQSPENYTLQIALKFCMSTYMLNWQKIMAGSVLALAPTLILYMFAQKSFHSGIVMSGLKG